MRLPGSRTLCAEQPYHSASYGVLSALDLIMLVGMLEWGRVTGRGAASKSLEKSNFGIRPSKCGTSCM